MKEWKHLTIEQRKTISSGISHEYKLKDIGESLLVDPTSISKEVKRNRIEISIGLKNDCKRNQRWPYVCTGCKNRYNNCPYTKYKYEHPHRHYNNTFSYRNTQSLAFYINLSHLDYEA